MSINFIMQSTNLAPTHTETTMSSGSEDELQDFKTLQTTVGNHLKEISNVSRVFDQATGLLPDSLEELTKVLLDHHDREVLYNWDPTEQNELGCKQYEVVVTEQKCLLKLRNLMIRYMNVFLDANLPGSSEKGFFILFFNPLLHSFQICPTWLNEYKKIFILSNF